VERTLLGKEEHPTTEGIDMKTSNRIASLNTVVHLTAIVLLVAPMGLRSQSVLPNTSQPADMPPPKIFSVTTIDYLSYDSTALVTGAGKTFGMVANTPFSFDSATPNQLTLNFAYPFEIQYGDGPQSVYAVDSKTGTYVGESVHGRGYVVNSNGGFELEPVFPPQLVSPPGANIIYSGIQSVLIGADGGKVVGTASYSEFTQIPLNGGDGVVASGPVYHFQFPIIGTDPVFLGTQLPGSFTRARGFRGNQIVGDATTNINYNPADSSPGPWNTSCGAWVMDISQPGSATLLAGVPSMATATDGTRQGGWVGLHDGSEDYHATIWSNSAASAVDLNPDGYFNSRVTGMSAEFQVGDGWLGGPANSPGATQHALLWHGTADSVIDLNQFLPPSIAGAEINGADANGNIVGSYSIQIVCTNCTIPIFQQVAFVMNLNPALSLASLTLDSSNAPPGGSVTATVSLNAPAASGGVTVSFTTTDATLVPAPQTLVIPEGQIAVSFTLPTSPNTLTNFMTAPASATVTAHTGFSASSATLTVAPATPPDPVASVSFNPANISPGDSATGSITLSQPAPAGGVIVNFLSESPAIVATPASVVVPAGQTAATFPIAANPILPSVTPVTVVIHAATGNIIKDGTLIITPILKVSWVYLSTAEMGRQASSVTGGDSLFGMVFTTAAEPTPITISLASDNPALLVPPTVVIQPSQTSPQTWATFTVNTLPVPGTTSGKITASANGTSASTPISIMASPAPTITSVTIPILSSSQTWSSGQTLTGTVTLSSGAFVGGMIVTLTSDTPSAAQVPASVIIPAGAKTATFPVIAGQVSVPTPVSITASLNGIAATPVSLTVIPGAPLALSSSAIAPYTMIGPGIITTVTITVNQVAPPGGLVINLSASSPAAKVPATVTIPAGQTTASFSIQGNSVSNPTSVWVSATYKGVLAPLGTILATSIVTVAPSDVLKASKPTWSSSTHVLTASVTSTNPQATISVLNASGNVPIGTMINLGGGNHSFQTNVASISAVDFKSNLGGATGQGVTVVP
jgi:hypothetical protein